ncbi:hypothetical protein [Rickettsiella endosymbiont of Miltochrista miniata]|uniref:hypothetical protein n=1 Tax=Rickettsiella endosymbiont of Miltochrista miniata TaxID=3066239 RepID=UPI00313DE220
MPALNPYTALESAKAHLSLQRELAIILKNDPVTYLKKSGIILANFIQYLKDHIAHYGTPVCSLEQLDKLKGPFSASGDTKDYFTFLSSLKNNTLNTTPLNCPNDIPSIDARLANITSEFSDNRPTVSNPTLFNTTISDDISNEITLTGNTDFSLPAKLGTAFGFGFGIGFLDGASQVVLHIAKRYDCTPRTLGLLTIALALATTVGVSALPLIYSIVTTLDNDQIDPQVNSENVQKLTFVFMATLALHLLKNTPRYLGRLNDFLNTNAMLKSLLQNLPLFGCLFITAYGNDSFLEGLSIAMVTLLGAAIPSNATRKILSCFPLSSTAVSNTNVSDGMQLDSVANTNEFEMDIVVDSKIHLTSVKQKIAASTQQDSTTTLAIGNPAPKEANGYLPFNSVKYSSMLFKTHISSSENIPNTSAVAIAQLSRN